MSGDHAERDRRRWATPTGAPCPRAIRLDGTVEGTGDCLGCGFCLLLAALVDDLPAGWTD